MGLLWIDELLEEMVNGYIISNMYQFHYRAGEPFYFSDSLFHDILAF
jgi:hypothetical protein